MTIRNRLRKWLGIESDLAEMRTAAAGLKTAIEGDFQNVTNVLISEINKLKTVSAKNEKDISDACAEIKKIRSDVASYKADCVAMFESAKKDYGLTVDGILSLRKDHEAYRMTFFQRMDAAENAIKAQGKSICTAIETAKFDTQTLRVNLGEIWGAHDKRIGELSKTVEDATNAGSERYKDLRTWSTLNAENHKSLEERIVAVETASRNFGGHLHFIATNASSAQRDRVIALIEDYHSSGFRPAHREALIKLIRGEV